uniref:Uncharacterized protein n=1 Tax=Anguilla anguilla TaxID=7936 RepID=A0A0E9SA65_ANGAN
MIVEPSLNLIYGKLSGVWRNLTGFDERKSLLKYMIKHNETTQFCIHYPNVLYFMCN